MRHKIKSRVKLYHIISEAVEQGVEYGYNRAHKHTSTPDKSLIVSEIECAVLNALSEILDME